MTIEEFEKLLEGDRVPNALVHLEKYDQYIKGLSLLSVAQAAGLITVLQIDDPRENLKYHHAVCLMNENDYEGENYRLLKSIFNSFDSVSFFERGDYTIEFVVSVAEIYVSPDSLDIDI